MSIPIKLLKIMKMLLIEKPLFWCSGRDVTGIQITFRVSYLSLNLKDPWADFLQDF